MDREDSVSCETPNQCHCCCDTVVVSTDYRDIYKTESGDVCTAEAAFVDASEGMGCGFQVPPLSLTFTTVRK